MTEHSNTAIIVSVLLAHDMSCWHHWSKVKEAIKRVEEEGLHHTNNVKEETERCLRIFLKSRCTVIHGSWTSWGPTIIFSAKNLERSYYCSPRLNKIKDFFGQNLGIEELKLFVAPDDCFLL